MIRIAIVENETETVNEIKDYVARVFSFVQEFSDQSYSVDVFADGMTFISDYLPRFDVVICEVALPLINGISMARRLRAFDETVTLIFISDEEKDAIEGYEVDAVGFVLKPLSYNRFSKTLIKAIKTHIAQDKKAIVIKTEDGFVSIPCRDISYIVKEEHNAVVHVNNKTYAARINVKDIEDKLYKHGFAKCNRGCLVNLRAIDKIINDDIYVGNDILPLSRRQKKEFYKSFFKK